MNMKTRQRLVTTFVRSCPLVVFFFNTVAIWSDLFKCQSTYHFKQVGEPTGSVQGYQPEPPAQPRLLRGFPPSKPIFCKASLPSRSSTFLTTRWSLEHFTCPYKSARNKSAPPCRAPKPPVRVEQEKTPAVLLPAIRRDVQRKVGQPCMGRENGCSEEDR